MKTVRNYEKYPLRACRSMHWCEICESNIVAGEWYFDGGYSRRAHRHCWEEYKLFTRALQDEPEKETKP